MDRIPSRGARSQAGSALRPLQPLAQVLRQSRQDLAQAQAGAVRAMRAAGADQPGEAAAQGVAGGAEIGDAEVLDQGLAQLLLLVVGEVRAAAELDQAGAGPAGEV